ncbi:MAG: hypothetical protein LBR66_03970 [Candidatus Symbiothrix sp.]|jgi:hypothetical protein|nr:hypothetical protein [Candidatus Symbiothrix sp.]
MKKLRFNLIFAAMCSMFLWSCGDDESGKTGTPTLAVSKQALQFDVKPSEAQTIDILSNTAWTASTETGVDWITLTPTSGQGNATLSVAVANNTGSERQAMISIAAKGVEIQNITVTQTAYKGQIYNFADFTGLEPGGELVDNVDCDDGKALKITTRANSEDRIKTSTVNQFGSGRFEWRIYVSDFGLNDRASIGAFLYSDDTHELDFEIGSGTATNRSAYNAQADEVLCYATSQSNPRQQKIMTIKNNAWHTFVIDVKLVDGKYFAEWLVDGVSFTTLQLIYGEEFPFRAFCSVENLSFIGDHLPNKDNYALFDYIEYLPYEYSMRPIDPNDIGSEPEPNGTTIRLDFNEAGVVPEGWAFKTNGTASIADGYLNLTNAGDATSNLSYTTAQVGIGKYTWRIFVPAIGLTEKFMTGGSLYTEEGGEKSFSFMVFSGTADNRSSCTPPPTSSQVLLRCYTESGTTFKPILPNKEYTLTLDLRNKNGKYAAIWLLDGETIKTAVTFYDVNTVKFDLSTVVFANGGAWQGSINCSKDYTAKYDYIEYKKYEY